ncbi:MAG: hypothetical protein HC819_20105 [Cyclobacteriaceae bacterium]|nr:hypothetical protein [Cyclobacteriaceae bacterium]
MALSNAIQFIHRLKADQQYRSHVYQKSKEEVLNHYGFDEIEFENALYMQLLKCQTYEEAEVVLQIKMCFSML